MISRPLHESGGLTRDYFNIATIFIIGLVNFINQLLEGKDIIDRLYLTLPLIFLSFLIYNYNTSKATKAFIFSIFGVYYHIFAIPDSSYIGSSMFFCLAYMQFPNIQFGVFLSLIVLTSLIIKTTKSNYTPSQTIGVISAFVFLLGNVYLEIQEWKDKIKYLNDYYINQINKLKEELKKALNGETDPIKNIDTINITQEEKAILHLYCEGYDYNRIQKTLGLNIAPNSVRRKITAIKKENKNKILNGKSKDTNINDAQFGKWLYQKV